MFVLGKIWKGRAVRESLKFQMPQCLIFFTSEITWIAFFISLSWGYWTSPYSAEPWVPQYLFGKWLPFGTPGPWGFVWDGSPKVDFLCLYVFTVHLGFLPSWISQFFLNSINQAEVDLNFMWKTALLQSTTIFYAKKKTCQDIIFLHPPKLFLAEGKADYFY